MLTEADPLDPNPLTELRAWVGVVLHGGDGTMHRPSREGHGRATVARILTVGFAQLQTLLGGSTSRRREING